MGHLFQSTLLLINAMSSLIHQNARVAEVMRVGVVTLAIVRTALASIEAASSRRKRLRENVRCNRIPL